MYSYVDLTATVLNCRLPTTRHINYIGLSWSGSLITLLHLQLIWFALPIFHVKTETGKTETSVFCAKPN